MQHTVQHTVGCLPHKSLQGLVPVAGMLALKACIAPKSRRRGRGRAPRTSSAGKSAHGSASIPREDGTPREGGAKAVTAHFPQHVERPTLSHSDSAPDAARRNRSGSWENAEAQSSPQPSCGSRDKPHDTPSDTRRQRHETETQASTRSNTTQVVENRPAYTPVSRLEWSSSISSDSPHVRSGCCNTAPLPAGWFQAERDGVAYYYNRRTGKRLWHHPSGCACPVDTPLPLKTLSTASSAQQSPAAWTRSGSSEGGNTPHSNAYYYRRGWHGAAPTLSLSTNSSGARTTSAGTGISARTASYATSRSQAASEQSPNTKSGASKTYSVASAAAPYPPPPTPVGRGLLAESGTKQSGRPGAPRRSIVKLLAQLDRELVEGASSTCGQPPHPKAQTPAAQQPQQEQQQKKTHPALKQCSIPAPTVSPAAEAVAEEGFPPQGAAMAPRGRTRQPRSRRGSFAESVLSQPASIPDEPSSARTCSDHDDGSGKQHDLRDLGRGWALSQKKRLSTKYETDFEGSGMEIEQVSRFEAVSNQHEV